MEPNNIQNGLQNEAQRLIERVPENANAENTRGIADALRVLMQEKQVSQATVAKWVGYSASTVSDFLRGTYCGDLGKVCNRIVNILNESYRRQGATKDRKPYVETSVALAVMELIRRVESFSDDEGMIGLVIGDGGHGKSICLRQYAKANLNSLYIQLDGTMTALALFRAIGKELGIDTTGVLSDLAVRLIEVLRHRHLVVMLDEASGLKVRQLNQLRQVIVVKGKCPLILAGNQNLLHTVMQPATARGCESLDQFTSRMAGVLNLDERAAQPDGGLYTPDDIRKLYEYGGVRLTTDGVNALRRIGKTPQSGRFRTCSIIIAALHSSGVVQEKGLIDAKLICEAIRQLKLPVAERLPVSTIRQDREIEVPAAAAG